MDWSQWVHSQQQIGSQEKAARAAAKKANNAAKRAAQSAQRRENLHKYLASQDIEAMYPNLSSAIQGITSNKNVQGTVKRAGGIFRDVLGAAGQRAGTLTANYINSLGESPLAVYYREAQQQNLRDRAEVEKNEQEYRHEANMDPRQRAIADTETQNKQTARVTKTQLGSEAGSAAAAATAAQFANAQADITGSREYGKTMQSHANQQRDIKRQLGDAATRNAFNAAKENLDYRNTQEHNADTARLTTPPEWQNSTINKNIDTSMLDTTKQYTLKFVDGKWQYVPVDEQEQTQSTEEA